MSSSNGIITNPMNIANAFSDYFINIGPTLANNIPKSTKSPADYLNLKLKLQPTIIPFLLLLQTLKKYSLLLHC